MVVLHPLPARRAPGDSENGPGYLASVSDLMVGVLFVFILALVFVAQLLQSAKVQNRELTDACAKATAQFRAGRPAMSGSGPCAVAELIGRIGELQRDLVAAERGRDVALTRATAAAGEVVKRDLRIGEVQRNLAAVTGERDAAVAQKANSEHREREMQAQQASLATAREEMHAFRASFLSRVRERMKREYDYSLDIDENAGILRLAKLVTFSDASSELDRNSRSGQAVRALADILVQELPCYVAGDSCTLRANAKTRGVIDAMLIEGHTDARPLGPGGRYRDNHELSTGRAWATFNLMKQSQPELEKLRNSGGEPVMSQSGYGPGRPVEKDAKNSEQNRRIDIRFIMAPSPPWLKSPDGG